MDEYQLMIENENMRTYITQLENSNKTLKEQIMTLAMQNSEMLQKEKKRKKYTFSTETKERWEFYHKYKTESDCSNLNWKIIKDRSDKIYYTNKLKNGL
jgi:hypothetical protein